MTTVPPSDPIARLRDVVKHQPNFRGSRNDLLFLLDTIAELQDDSDVESVRHALQTSEARVDRLTAEQHEFEVDIRAALLQGNEDDANQPTEILAENVGKLLKEAAVTVDRLTAALRAYVDWFGAAHEGTCPADDTCACSCAGINDAVNAALAPADPEPPHE